MVGFRHLKTLTPGRRSPAGETPGHGSKRQMMWYLFEHLHPRSLTVKPFIAGFFDPVLSTNSDLAELSGLTGKGLDV
jgi:hypothetical protein